MSIQSEITRIAGNVSDALDAIANKGVTVPVGSNSDDLATLIAQITGGGGSAIVITDTIDPVSGGTIRTITAVDISGDTVTASDMLYGVTAHDASGTAVTGNIVTKTQADLSASGDTVTAPAGYYASSASKSVASGSVTAPSAISGTSATVSTGTNTLTLSKTVSVTPSVTAAGYVSGGTAGNSSVSLTANVTTQAAQTIHPSTSDQTISSGRYLTGNQTIKAVTVSGLSASNVLSGVTVKIGDSTDDDCVTSVSGSVSFQTIYSGSSAPSAAQGVDGDIYIQT